MSSVPRQPQTSLVSLYDLVTGDEDARVCKDIPEAACRDLPQNFFLHLISSAATKIGDELASAKLILPWLLASLGAPGFLIGLLVPIRESGALLPQLIVAAYIRRVRRRKWFWVAGSVLQGLVIFAVALVGLTLTGALAGWMIVGLLVIFSLARGVCSVAHKDVIGKTVSKNRRGTLMGYAGAVAGLVTVTVGVYAKFIGDSPQVGFLFFAMLAAAGLLWVFAAIVFGLLREQPGATEGGGNAIVEALRSVGLLASDAKFRHFVLTRALLLSVAFSLPFYVVFGQEQTGGEIEGLGLMLVASGVAGSLSAPVWGRLADRSSRLVMVFAAAAAGIIGLAVFALSGVMGSVMRDPYAFAVIYLLVAVAYAGARLGRKTYLVDMATAETRAAYVALSNTLIGALMLVGGAIGVIADAFGVRYVILVLAVIALFGAMSAWRLDEAEAADSLSR